MRISYSAFDTYSRCPAQYKFNYIDRVAVPKKIELEFGSLMHTVVEHALKRDPIVPPLEDLLKLFDENFAKISFADNLQESQYQNVGREMIRVFFDSLTPGLRTTIATEKRFYLDLNDQHALSGVIDRIDKLPFGPLEVIDYKTNFKPKTQAEIDLDKQLGIYKMAVEYFWPEAKEIRLSMYFLRSNIKLTTSRRTEETEELKKEVIDICDKIGVDQEFIPKKNPLCDWCDYQHLCPLMKDKIAADGKPGEIDHLIEQYIEASQKIALIEPQIHAHFDREKIENYDHKKGRLKRTQGKIKVEKN